MIYERSLGPGGAEATVAHILAFNGSPRIGGNTHTLLAALLESAEAAGARTELVQLRDVTIRECDNCHACWRGTRCAKADGMQEIYTKIAIADVLVFGTPVYWYAATGLIKLLMDRLVYFNCPANRPQIRGKRAAAVIPSEEGSADVSRPLVEFFERCMGIWRSTFVGALLAPGVTGRGEVRERAEYMRRASALVN